MRKIIATACIITAIIACGIWVLVKPTHLVIQPSHLNMLVCFEGEEDEYYEELTVLYKGIQVKPNKITWTSENPDIAIIENDGWVTSTGVGKTVITAEYKGLTAQCEVKVTEKITSDSED